MSLVKLLRACNQNIYKIALGFLILMTLTMGILGAHEISQELSFWTIEGRGNFEKKINEMRSLEKCDVRQIVEAIADSFYPRPTSIYERKYPLGMGLMDTQVGIQPEMREYLIWILGEEVVRNVNNYLYDWDEDPALRSRILSPYGKGALSYQDEDIVGVLSLINVSAINSPYFMGFDHDNRYVIQQNGQRGCVPAATAMVLSDKLKKFIYPINVSLENDDYIYRTISKHGLRAITTTVNSYDELKLSLEESGPACISVETCGAHEIVVDAILDKGVQIRDPYHGWSIIVSKEAFSRTTNFTTEGSFKIIQAVAG